jgi:hypothetical protein
MSTFSDLLAKAIEQGARSLDDPSQDQILTALRRGRVRRRIRYALLTLGGTFLVTAVALPVVFLSGLRPPSDTGTTPTPASSPSTEISISPPAGPGPFHGETYRENGFLVMPITFPDGTTAEVVYPATLDLGTDYVYPLAYVTGGPKECHQQMYFSRSEIAGSVITNEPPLAVFEGADGDPVALWAGKRWAEPRDFLAFDFGDWVVALFCEADPDEDADALSLWARSLNARPTPDGLLVLDLRSPVRLVRGQDGPSVAMNGDTPFTLVKLTVSGCSPSPIELAPSATAHGCFDGGIKLYALGNRAFLTAVSDGLQVRNVEKPAG